MANDVQSYLIKLEADGAKLKTESKASTVAIVRLEKELRDLEKQQKRTGRSAKDLGGKTSGMGRRIQDAARSMAVIQGPLGGIAGRMSSLGSVISQGSLKWIGLSAAIGGTLAIQKSALAAFAETENQLARISSQLQLTGNGVGFTTNQLDGFARQQARLTLASSEDVREAISVLLTFRSISGETFKDAVKASNAISAITGASVKSSAIQLGKALEDARTGLTALRRQGISFSDEQRKEIIRLADEGRQAAAMEQVIGIINQQIPDASKGVGELSGKVDSLKQSWREMLEVIADNESAVFLIEGLNNVFKNVKNFIDPDDEQEARKLARSIRELKKEIIELENRPQRSGRSGAVDRRLLSEKRSRLKQEIAIGKATLKARDDVNAQEQQVATDAQAKQGAIEAANIARIERERQLVFAGIAAKTRIKIERDRAKTETAILRDQLRAGEISYASFYAKIESFQIQSIDNQIAAVNAKVESLRAENATVIQIRRETTKLVELQAKKVEIGRRNNLELEKERTNLQNELRDVERQVSALTGNPLGAQIVAIEDNFAKLKARLEANGASSEAVDKLIDIKKAKAGMDEIDRRFKALSESLNREEQGIDVDLSTGLLTELQARRELVQVHEKYQRQIAELIPQAEKLAAVTGNPEAIQNIQALTDKVDELGRRTNLLVTETKGAFEDAFVDSLSSIGTEITTLDELWRSFSTNVLSSLQQIAAERVTAELFSLLPGGADSARQQNNTGGNVSAGLGAAGSVASAVIDGGDKGITPGDQLVTDAVKSTGQSQKQGIISQLLSLAASIFIGDSTQATATTAQTVSVTALLTSINTTLLAGLALAKAEIAGEAGDSITSAIGLLAHSGRVVGAGGGASRSVPASTFAGAARFHEGGFAGLSSDEVPAILQKREEVLAADDPRNALNGGLNNNQSAPPQINVMNVLDTTVLHDETATFLNSGDGENLIVNIMQKNRATLGI